MITVMKFGGTSVGSAEAIQRVADIIISTEGDRVVVASAMSGITNFLVKLVDNPPEDIDAALREFTDKHINAAKEMFDGEIMTEFRKEFDNRLENFKRSLQSNPNDPYYKDLITSQGERFSTLMLSFYLKKLGHESVALTAETAGIAAKGLPLSGSADLEETSRRMNEKVRPYLEKGIIPIITGFYGIKDGSPLTFGRGGSDYSAAVVANGLNADMLEIWTDVDGFMTSDPRVVKNAIKMNVMTFEEAAELAYFGAKVLHPRTIEPVRVKNIPLKVRNSFRPSEPGTLIHGEATRGKSLLKSVASKNDLTIVTIRSSEIAYKPEDTATIINKIAESNVVIYSISTSLSTVAFLVETGDLDKILKGLDELDDIIENVTQQSNVSMICCVGDDLITSVGLAGSVFTAVKEADASVLMISEGASNVALNFVVPGEKVTDVIISLHGKYIG